MSQHPHVIRRGGSYSFRIRVPERFRAVLGRKELWRSLGTGELNIARQRSFLALLLTQQLWEDLEAAMSSSPTPPSPLQIQKLINGWLKAELERDGILRRRNEPDREGEWFAGVIMERTPDGMPDRLIETLNETQLDELSQLDPAKRQERCGPPRFLLTDVTNAHLERFARHKVYEASARRFATADTSIASSHAEELFAAAGLVVPRDSDAFDVASRLMARAHRDLLRAVEKRDLVVWRPVLDDDPAQDLLDKVKEDASEPAPTARVETAPVAPLSRRAGLLFSEAVKEALLAISRTETFKPKRRDDDQTAIDPFIDWFGRDPSLGEITSQIAGDYQVALGGYPTNARKRPAYRDVGSFAARHAKATELDDPATLGPVTINGKYLTPLRRIYAWHEKAGSELKNPFDGIAAQKPRKIDLRKKRRDYTMTEVQRFFDLPAFTGAKSLHGYGSTTPGDKRIRDYRFWVPLICFFSGMRLNEACGLAMADVKEEGGIIFFHVRDDFEDQSVKGNASRRKVPLHRQLIELGLVDQIKVWKAEGRERLFPELVAGSTGYYSHGPSKLFNKWTRHIADKDPDDPGRLVFHCSRHTVVTRLRAAKVRQDISQEIVGHEQGDVHSGYGHVDVPTLKEHIDMIEYPGLYLGKLMSKS